MNPGRELDALVAEKVMGLKNQNDINDSYRPYGSIRGDIKYYSTSIEAAWQVINSSKKYLWKFRREIEWVNVGGKIDPDRPPINEEDLQKANTYGCWKYLVTPGVAFTKDSVTGCSYRSMAHAICLAALKACGVEV